MEFKDYSSWNEFDWELEIRKDDARVAAYIQELPKYIDLPGEDSILMRTIKRKLGSEKDDDEWGPVPYDESGENQEIIPFSNMMNWKNVPGGVVYHNCFLLSRDFSLAVSMGNHEKSRLRIMRILSLYGQLMARAGSLIDMFLEVENNPEAREEYEVPEQLKLALIKRLLALQNQLTAELRLFAKEEPELKNMVEFHLETTGKMHDHLVDLLIFVREKIKNEHQDTDDFPPF